MDKINTIFLFVTLVPLTLGLGYLFVPKAMRKRQAWFRKKLEKMERRFYKRHRLVGLSLTAFSLMMVYTYFQPVWLYNMFVAARLVMGVFFPAAFQQVQQVQATPMVCI